MHSPAYPKLTLCLLFCFMNCGFGVNVSVISTALCIGSDCLCLLPPAEDVLGMTVAALTGNTSGLCISGRQAAVASYGRALSRLRVALSVSCKRAVPFRETVLVRCCSAAAAAPPQATKQQLTQVLLSLFLLTLSITTMHTDQWVSKANKFEAVIGIETHVQLKTHTKAFCNCKSLYGDEPNTHVCAVCLGHPVCLCLCQQSVTQASYGMDSCPAQTFL